MGKCRQPGQRTQVRKAQRGYREFLLAVNVEHRPAAHYQLQPGAAVEELGDDVGPPRQQLLVVVEDQQRCAVPQMVEHGLQRQQLAGDRDAERVGDCRRDQRRIANRREGDEVDAVGEAVHHLGRHLQAEPGLAGAAGAGERQQP